MHTATPQKLYLMQLSTATVPTPKRKLEMVSGCYLIETSAGKHILIDSGMPTAVQLPAGAPPSENEKNVLEHLSELGLRPADIDMLICTHFDVDHAGYHDAFPQAEFIVQRAHYELAKSGHPRFAAARQHWDHPALRYRLIDGDTELLPGLKLLETSGHTTGHQSVLVHLPETGAVLLAVDAVMMQSAFTPDRAAWPMDENEEQLRASTRKLLDLVEHEHVALVVFGHDGQHWQTLKKAPAYYG
ncbi:N-acyl homoserine lactonase family protein [Ktedonosporobacter rubrisoli]|uniref:N-acyl homoserine lactonase family protein n=1 Tax=Ktedonosporobacter rubrisoli TaxID=2509675 RepID=A0A4P6JKQ4_KTERU|nr:N-acyl homoserine lactonase family protein [Ktedonosporobacter rubrisoli]QBD75236.1 N-acyl homoserine lactonase family protein [Ktedonosporobacter rubrisoli]